LLVNLYGGQTFGTDTADNDSSGDFNFFSSTSAPNGSATFTLRTSIGQYMALTYLSETQPVEIAMGPGVGSCSPSTNPCDNFGGSYDGNFQADVVDVQSGQLTLVTVAPVPLPATAWLMLSGVLALGLFGRWDVAARVAASPRRKARLSPAIPRRLAGTDYVSANT
jgi:hypothetical protein